MKNSIIKKGLGIVSVAGFDDGPFCKHKLGKCYEF